MKAKVRYNVYIVYPVTKACMVNCVSFALSETVDYCVRYSEMSPVFSPKSALLVGLGLFNGRNAAAVHIYSFVIFTGHVIAFGVSESITILSVYLPVYEVNF